MSWEVIQRKTWLAATLVAVETWRPIPGTCPTRYEYRIEMDPDKFEQWVQDVTNSPQ